MISKACTVNEIEPLMIEYLQQLSSPFDSFLEEHILGSTFYVLQEGTEDVGYAAIHKASELLTQF